MAATPDTSPLDRHASPVSDHNTATGRKSGMATASMVLGILAIPFVLLWPIAVILAIVGIVLGAIARGQIRRDGLQGGGQAMAGIVCSVVALVGVAALLIAAAASTS